MLMCHSVAAQGRREYQVESKILVFFFLYPKASPVVPLKFGRINFLEVRACMYSCPDKRITVVTVFSGAGRGELS